MLKEVGASGQISLGKKYAGQLFDLQTQADGRITLQPVKVVPASPAVQQQPTRPPASHASASAASARGDTAAWAEAHAQQIAEYNAWASQREPYAQRVRRWRSEGR